MIGDIMHIIKYISHDVSITIIFAVVVGHFCVIFIVSGLLQPEMSL